MLDRLCLDLSALSIATANEMRLLAQEKEITLRTSAGERIYVEGDRTRLQQVIANLIDNAIKYTQQGGTVELSVHSDGGKAILEVRDNGAGIPAEAICHVFERFYRVDKARSRSSGGAGLGLSIVKAICAAHGAEIGVSSQEGRGSCFRVEFPLAVAFENRDSDAVLRKVYR
jgi:signal transduction histidine kinase